MSMASFDGEHGKFRVDRLAQRLMLNDATQGPIIIPKNELSNAQSLMEINLSSSLRSSTPPLPGHQSNGIRVPNVEVGPPADLSDDELSLHNGGGGGRRSPPHARSPHHHADDDSHARHPSSMSPRGGGGHGHHQPHPHAHHHGGHGHGGYDQSPHHAHHEERYHGVSRDGGHHDHHSGGRGGHYSHHTPRSGGNTPRGGDYDSHHRHSDHGSRGREREYYDNGQPGSRHSSHSRRRSRSPIESPMMRHSHHHQHHLHQEVAHRNGGGGGGGGMHHRSSRMSSMESERSYPSGRSRSPNMHRGGGGGPNEHHMHSQRGAMRVEHHPQRYDSPSPRNGGEHHHPHHGGGGHHPSGGHGQPMVDDRSFGGRHSPPPHLNVGDEYVERGRRLASRNMRSRSYRSRSPLPRDNAHNPSSGLNLHSLTKAMFPNSPVAPRQHNSTRGSISRENSPSPMPHHSQHASPSTPHAHRNDGGSTHRGGSGSGGYPHVNDHRTPTHPSAMAVGGDSPSPSSPRHGLDGGRHSPPPSSHHGNFSSGHDISPSASSSPMYMSANGGSNGDMNDKHMANGRSHYQQHHGNTLHSPHPHRPVTRSPLSPSPSPSPRHSHASMNNDSMMPVKTGTGRKIIGEIHSPRSGSPSSPLPLSNGASSSVGIDSGAVAGPGSPVDTHHRPLTRNMGSVSPSSAANGGGKVSPTAAASVSGDNGPHPHRCGHCGKTFPKRHNLITHQATHLKKKPHRCELCNKHFSRKGNMQRHIIALHFGEKPYECEYCKKKFNDSSNMRKHIKNQHLMKLDYDGMPQTPTTPGGASSSPSTPHGGALSGLNDFRSPRGGANNGRMFRSRHGNPVIGSALPPMGLSMPPMMMGANGLPLPMLPMGGSSSNASDLTSDKYTPTNAGGDASLPRRSMRVLRSNIGDGASGLPMPLPLAAPSAPLPFPAPNASSGMSSGWFTQPTTSSALFPQLPGTLPFNSTTTSGVLPGLSGTSGVSRAPLNPSLPLPNPSLSSFPSPFGLMGVTKSTDTGASTDSSRSGSNSEVPMPLPLSTPSKSVSTSGSLNGTQGSSPAPLISALLNPPLPFPATNFQMPNSSASTGASSGAAAASSPLNSSTSSAPIKGSTSASASTAAAATTVAASA